MDFTNSSSTSRRTFNRYVKEVTNDSSQSPQGEQVVISAGRKMLNDFESQMALKKVREEPSPAETTDLEPERPNGLRSMSFQPRDEQGMPFNSKVWSWLEKINLPTVDLKAMQVNVCNKSPSRSPLQCKMKRPYPVAGSDTASYESESGHEQHSRRKMTRKVLGEYRMEVERPYTLMQSRSQPPAWHSAIKSNQQIQGVNPSVLSTIPNGAPMVPALCVPGTYWVQPGNCEQAARGQELVSREYVADSADLQVRDHGDFRVSQPMGSSSWLQEQMLRVQNPLMAQTQQMQFFQQQQQNMQPLQQFDHQDVHALLQSNQLLLESQWQYEHCNSERQQRYIQQCQQREMYQQQQQHQQHQQHQLINMQQQLQHIQPYQTSASLSPFGDYGLDMQNGQVWESGSSQPQIYQPHQLQGQGQQQSFLPLPLQLQSPSQTMPGPRLSKVHQQPVEDESGVSSTQPYSNEGMSKEEATKNEYNYRDELKLFGSRGAYYSTELNAPIRRGDYVQR